jgi:hypothetical protein
MLSLELIDAGLVLATQRGDTAGVIAEEPGVAVLEENQTVTGSDAAARVRLKPLLAHTNFWREVSTEPLARPTRQIRTSADLAFAQASALFETVKGRESGVLLAVPAGYSREQLGLLLGIVNETGVSVAGIVDAALAACSYEPAPPRILHLELELHQALLTVLEYAGGDRPGLKRARYEILPRNGMLAIQQSWLQMIAEQFVRKTRFDPLHDAKTEQRLLDQLPELLQHLADHPQVPITMQLDERVLEIEVERNDFIGAADKQYAELQRLVQESRVAGLAIELRLSHRVAVLPGLIERLSGLRDCEVKVLPRGAAALSALHYANAIRRPAEALALVYQLPAPRAAASGAASASQQASATPAALRPTHVLFQGRAWQLSERALAVGWAAEGHARKLTLPAASPGVSRTHCTLVRRHGSILVEDHSTYGSFVNDERVVGNTVLTVGDRLRLGTPGVTLELIQMVNDNGTPQD